MNPLAHLFSEAFVRALGQTLLHSLWQGALIALLLAFLLYLLHRHTPQVRYLVSIGALVLTLAAAVFTFGKLYVAETPVAPAPALAAQVVVKQAPEVVAEPERWAFVQEYLGYFEQHLPLIVTVWLLGILLMTLRMLGSLAYVQRMRSYQVKPLPAEWQERLELLAQELKIKQKVQLVESVLVRMPLTVGHLKPVILLPVGVLTGLPQSQLEAVLAHELAHIARRDYLVNLLQHLIEILFFYHPAVWWMSAQVRDEREHCCDDMAVNVCAEPLVYAKALANVAALLQPVQQPAAMPMPALAVTGRKNSLLGRIRRLLEQPGRTPSFSEGFMAAIVLAGAVLVLSSNATAGLPAAEPAIAEMLPPGPADPLGNPDLEESVYYGEGLEAVTKTMQDSTGKAHDLIIIQNKKGKVVELYVDGKRVPKEDIADYQPLIEKSLQGSKKAPKLKTTEEKAAARKTAKQQLKIVEKNNRRNDYTYSYNYSYSGTPAPPPAPAPRVMPAPAPYYHHQPVRPMKPAAPMVPKTPAPVAPVPPVPPVPPVGDANDAKYKKEKEKYNTSMKKYEADQKKYEAEMKDWAEQMRAWGRAYGEAYNNSPEMQQYREGMKQYAREMKEYSKQLQKAQVWTDDERRQFERDMSQYQRDMAQYQRDMQYYHRDMEHHQRDMERHQRDMERHQAEMNRLRTEGSKGRSTDIIINSHTRVSDIRLIRDELEKDKLISKGAKSYTFKLTDDEMVVNGEKQPKELKEKYLKMLKKDRKNEKFILDIMVTE